MAGDKSPPAASDLRAGGGETGGGGGGASRSPGGGGGMASLVGSMATGAGTARTGAFGVSGDRGSSTSSSGASSFSMTGRCIGDVGSSKLSRCAGSSLDLRLLKPSGGGGGPFARSEGGGLINKGFLHRGFGGERSAVSAYQHFPLSLDKWPTDHRIALMIEGGSPGSQRSQTTGRRGPKKSIEL